jgi:hypothetical protein
MLLKKFLLTGMAVLLSVSFILTGCPTDSDDGGGGDDTTPSETIKDVSIATTVAAGDNTLVVTADGGTLKSGLKVYVKDDGTAVTISTGVAPAGFTEAAAGGYQVPDPTGGEITVTGLAPATGTATAGVLKAGSVTVTLAADAQGTQVKSIAAGSGNSADETVITSADLAAADITPYDTLPDGAVVDPAVPLVIGVRTVITGGTVEAAAYTDEDGNGSFDEGETQVFTITLTAAGGYTFAGGLTAQQIANAVLGANFTGHIAAAGPAANPFVVTVTYTKPGAPDTPVPGDGLPGEGIVPYSAVPTGAPVDPAAHHLPITNATAITDVTVAAAAYTDKNGSKSFDGGDTQVFTITLTAAGGHTFAGSSLSADAVVAAALDANVFPPDALGGSAAIDGAASSGTTLVVKVTYTNQEREDTVITSGDLAGANITPYNTPPAEAEVSANLPLGTITAISAAHVAAAGGPLPERDTRVFTITLTPAPGRTFFGPGSLTVAEIVDAVLGSNFTRHISGADGTPDNPYVVTVTYTKPVVITAAELANITPRYSGKPDGEAFDSGPLPVATNSAIAGGTVAAEAASSPWGAGATQRFAITLVPNTGYTFAGTRDADIAAAVLGSHFSGNTVASVTNPDSYEATVTYTRPADTLITKALLDDAGIVKYETVPTGAAVSQSLTIGDQTAIASVKVEAEAVSGTWVVGSTQVFTITVGKNDWYTFNGAGKSDRLTADQIAAAVLGRSFAGQYTAAGTPGNPEAQVKVTYTYRATGSLTVTAGVDNSAILNGDPTYAAPETQVTALVNGNSGYAIMDWYIDGEKVVGVAQGTGTNTYVITKPGLSAKSHSLTVRATKDGIVYSQTVLFSVTE